MIEKLSEINEVLNNFIWSDGMLFLIIGAGAFLSVGLGFFQFRSFKMVIQDTFLSIFKNKHKADGKGEGMSQFQTFSTALAASMGTGNIVGVATALTLGGAGAIFWMWISAILGMMVTFGENILGIYYRYRNSSGEWVGGPMVYIEKGLNSKILGKVYALLCVLASFGIGNMTQANSIAEALKSEFDIKPVITGIITAVIVGIIIMGGMKRIGKITEILIPFISLAYIISSILIIVINFRAIPTAFMEIINGAFGMNAVTGGAIGMVVKNAISVGFRRGIFSNEAGLGTSALVHSSTEEEGTVKQGEWAMFEVFADTLICCTLTAFAILTSGAMKTELDGASLVIEAFKSGFGKFAGVFITFAIVLFAFATLLGWSFYGGKAFSYLFGLGGTKFYFLIFSFIIIIGAVTELKLVWGISDTLNGFMVIPNLIAVILLSKIIFSETEKFLKERKNNKK